MDIDRRLVLRRVLQATSAGALVALPALGRPRTVTQPVAAAEPALALPPSFPVPAAPPIVPRSAWQAEPPPSAVQYDRAVRAAFIHHTDDRNSYREQDVPDILRAIHHDHLANRGWDDIGYNFLVDRFGTVYEGRVGGIDRPVVGAHTMGFNRETVGIAAIGTYSAGVDVPEPVVAAIAGLVAWKLGSYGTDAHGQYELTSTSSDSRFPASSRHAFNAVSGHRDAYCTLCPGEALYALLPQITDRAADLQRAAGAGTGPHPQAPPART
ncbi:peptidoglycan recognition protein [Kitasatospora sp. NPDC059571]|uniref:peptidoglycan recognition protein family protein n=1 Tax=Kitasatospora sp. NPDC059571 TaxID=3346871 RepID=UPI0036A3BF07